MFKKEKENQIITVRSGHCLNWGGLRKLGVLETQAPPNACPVMFKGSFENCPLLWISFVGIYFTFSTEMKKYKYVCRCFEFISSLIFQFLNCLLCLLLPWSSMCGGAALELLDLQNYLNSSLLDVFPLPMCKTSVTMTIKILRENLQNDLLFRRT